MDPDETPPAAPAALTPEERTVFSVRIHPNTTLSSDDDAVNAAGSLFLNVELPPQVAHEIARQPQTVAEAGEQLFTLIRQRWVAHLEAGTMPGWAPLRPATVAYNARKGSATPDRPLIGLHGTIPRLLATLPFAMNVEQTPDGELVLDATYGPHPGQDQHPSQRYSDLFGGAPHDTPEAMDFGDRGVIPARPLTFDDELQAMVGADLEQWLAQMAAETEEPIGGRKATAKVPEQFREHVAAEEEENDESHFSDFDDDTETRMLFGREAQDDFQDMGLLWSGDRRAERERPQQRNPATGLHIPAEDAFDDVG